MEGEFLHNNHPTPVKLRTLYYDLQRSPTSGTVQNIVAEWGGELDPEHQALYEKMIENPNDKELEAFTVNSVFQLLQMVHQLITGEPIPMEAGRRRRTTKKRKTFKKRSTRRR